MSLAVAQKIVPGAVYVSLIGPLMQNYAKVPYADNNIEAGWICNQSKLKNLWCSAYTYEEVQNCIMKYGGQLIELYHDGFDFDMYELEQLRQQLKDEEKVTHAF